MVRTLAVVVAHPDDDTFGCSGTVALHADDAGFRFVLVHATSGEAGMISDPSLATRGTLGAVRQEEDRRSWITLGRPPDRHEWLSLPDGGIAARPMEELVSTVAEILREEQPDVVITFGPEGITAHTDHVAIGEATTRAFHEVRKEGVRVQRLLHQALSASMIDDWNRRLVAEGRDPIDTTQMYEPRGVPDETIGVDVDCTSVGARKLAALREHATQAGDIEEWSEEEQLEIMARELHVIAWPPKDPGTPVLRDVFEGLDEIPGLS